MAFLFVCLNKTSAEFIDLNTFVPDPPSYFALNITSDGSSATLYENQDLTPVALWKGDFQVAPDATELLFHYILTVAANNEDYFDFYAADMSAPRRSWGGSQVNTLGITV